MDKQTGTKLILYPMHQVEKKYSSMTTRALNEQDFSTLMKILEEEGYVWQVELKENSWGKFNSYCMNPTDFNPAEHVNRVYLNNAPCEISDFNIRLSPEDKYTNKGKKTIRYIHKSHDPKPADFMPCKKLIK